MKSLISFALCCTFLLCGCNTQREKSDITSVMRKVAIWQIDHFKYVKEGNRHDYGIDAWTNGVLYLGMSKWAKIANDTTYYNWLMNIGNENNWAIPANFKDYPKYSLYHADELCVAQFYLAMYSKFGDPKMIQSTLERINWIIKNPPSGDMSHKSKQAWTWCDALFMAPPVYVQAGQLTGEASYVEYMDQQYKATYNHLYSKDAKLFFRDDSYFDKQEANSQNVFWGRGNGWVVAGLANILEHMPKDSDWRPFYEKLYKDMIAKLVQLQDAHGFWHASLLDPESYPAPETSATAMITYAIAYGINNGLIDKKQYIAIANKSWKALVSVVDEQGKLGYVQPIGADPKKVTGDMTAVYGVGAFLMAGSEMYKLNQ